MTINAAQLCELLQGELIGDGGTEVYGPSQIDKGIPGTVTFLANPKYEPFAYTTAASILIVSRDFMPKAPVAATMIRVDDVYGAMIRLTEKFSPNGVPAPGISDLAVLDAGFEENSGISIGAYVVAEKGVRIGANSVIYPQVYIGHNAKIGEEVIIYPGVRIYPNTEIGDRCIIHANAVIGSDGFGYRMDVSGQYSKISHVGRVILEEDVEVGANTVIDRGTLQSTVIGRGTKIDNLVQIAHNVQIGQHTVIAAQAGVAGSSAVGNHVRVGGQVGIAGHLKIADNVEIQAQSGVHSGKFPAGSRLFGYPAIGYQEYLRSYAAFRQFPAYIRRIEELEKRLAELTNGKA